MTDGSPPAREGANTVANAEVVRELAMHASDGDRAEAVAALVGAIILLANDCRNTAGVIGCAIEGLVNGRGLALAADQRAQGRVKAASS